MWFTWVLCPFTRLAWLNGWSNQGAQQRKLLLQDEAPYFQEVLNDINQKISDLKDMNREQEIPELLAAQRAIQEQFDKATVLANQLEGVMADFSDERSNLQKEIEEETEWLNKMKDMLGKCDDVSGTDEDLVQRLQNCKVRNRSFKYG